MKVSHEWLSSYFTDTLPDADEIERVLGLRTFEPEGVERIGSDTVIDFDVLPNRAHDCLSHHGIAREISVLFNLFLKEEGRYIISNDVSISDNIPSVHIKDEDKCRRYISRVIENIEVRESPPWLKRRLEAIGQRSINNIVDATNYVMFDMGQPLHAFDVDKVGNNEIEVCPAKNISYFETLDGQTLELTDKDLIIKSIHGPLALAGVKGGKQAEVTKDTVSLILESANFDPVTVRKSSRRHNIYTDSSKRFENEPSPQLAYEGIEALTALILDVAGTSDTAISDVVDVHPSPLKLQNIEVELSHINTLLGINLSLGDVSAILDRFKFDFALQGDTIVVVVPWYRLDLRIAEDLIEEIGRVYGYEKIPAVVPTRKKDIAVEKRFYYEQLVRNTLVHLGFTEVMTHTFRKRGNLEMAYPVAKDRPFAREDLSHAIENILETQAVYGELLGTSQLKIFEIGTVFPIGNEALHISFGVTDLDENVPQRAEDALLEAREALIQHGITLPDIDGHIVEHDFDRLIAKAPQPHDYTDEVFLPSTEPVMYEQFSPYPFVLRDIAVWVPEEISTDRVLDVIQKEAGDLLVRYRQFDEYRPKDDPDHEREVSYAFHLVFQSKEKTLTDTEVNDIMGGIEKALESQSGWRVR